MRIRTTHVGSLPGPPDFDPSRASGSPRATSRGDPFDTTRSDDDLRESVRWVVDQQRAVGLDIINEGELTKGGDWLAFMDDRLGGFEDRPFPNWGSVLVKGRDREQFADFYKHASERQTLFFLADHRMRTTRRYLACVAPITYAGGDVLKRQIDVFLSVAKNPRECFFTSTAPASLEPYRSNEFYRSEEEFVFGLAEALRVEYEAIVNAGFLLQIDDAWLVALWDRIGIEMGLPAFKRRCKVRIEALNHALRNIPEDRVRYHLCWGSWHGPHAFDLPLADIVDVMLGVRARFYSFEAANVRHEHEYRVWEQVTLPDDKVLLPGVITHSTDLIEHPELVAERIRRFARIVGPERVIASADCGFGGRTHPQIAWAKLAALCEGARSVTASQPVVAVVSPHSDADSLRLLEHFADAWNRHDLDALMSMMTDDCVFEASAGPDVNGHRSEGTQAVRAAYAAVFETFPDAHWANARHFIAGTRGVSEWTFSGTRQDGQRVEVTGCDLFTFRDGKIAIKNSHRKNRKVI